MMYLSVIDPDLLVYDPQDFEFEASKTGITSAVTRMDALSLHRKMIREYDFRIAITQAFFGAIMEKFPWNVKDDYNFRDFKNFILQDLSRRTYYVDPVEFKELVITPSGVVCNCVECASTINTWEQLLIGCAENVKSNSFKSNVATWDNPNAGCSQEDSITIEYSDDQKAHIVYIFPTVNNENNWYRYLAGLDWWPDLRICVRLFWKTELYYNVHQNVYDKPISFECSTRFLSRLEQLCTDNAIRERLIHQLTKLLYGIRDEGLGHEPIKGRTGHYRFRISGSMRVHYFKSRGCIILDNIGPHDLDGVD